MSPEPDPKPINRNGRDDVPDTSDVVQDTESLGAEPQSSNRATVYEAAEILGVTVDAIRKRIQRGTIPHERHQDGRVYVLLDAATNLRDNSPSTGGTPSSTVPDAGRDELIESLKDHLEYLRGIIATRDQELAVRTEELRRKDHILAALTERIPELPPPAQEKAPGGHGEVAPEGVSEGDDTPVESREPVEKRRSWLYRFFFGE